MNPYRKPKAGTETLERIKRWPGLVRNLTELVRIHSGEHRAFWRAHGHGYTQEETKAGLFTIQEALSQTRHAGREKQISFISPF